MGTTRSGLPRWDRGWRSFPSLLPLVPLLVPALLSGGHVEAQHTEVPPPAAYALPGVTVVGPDGTIREDVTVVIRGELVQQIEPGAAVPADAEVLETEGLRVYPGMVDAWGGASLDLPAPPPGSEVTAWDASREAHGFTPQRRVVDHLTDVGTDFEPRRSEGVVASGVFPGQGFTAGVGAVLLHRPGAETPRELVAVAEAGLSMSFAPSSTSYPATLFGVMAYIRQAFLDAERHALVEAAYRGDPEGLTVPTWDPGADVLRQAAEGQLPVYFQADDAVEIGRVLELAMAVGFRPVIVGGGEAWRLAEELAALEVPVLVSMDFPEPVRWDPDDPEQAFPAELEPGAERERTRLTDRYANAGRLVEAGVTIALTSGGGAVQLREGIRRALAHGLGEEAALRAVTTAPAELLGIAPAVYATPGSAANLVVTDGPLFAEDTRIRHTFVEGVLQRGEEPGEEEAEGESDEAEEPDEPEDPDEPGDPDDPDAPGLPGDPVVPGPPEDLGDPDLPPDPGDPGDPDDPEGPGDPEDPEDPDPDQAGDPPDPADPPGDSGGPDDPPGDPESRRNQGGDR